MCLEDVRLMRKARPRHVGLSVGSSLIELVPYNKYRVSLLLARPHFNGSNDYLYVYYDPRGVAEPIFTLLSTPQSYAYTNNIGLDIQTAYLGPPDMPIKLNLLYDSGLVIGPIYGKMAGGSTVNWSYVECTLEVE